MLKNRIKTLIDLIENTEIEEIEVSSFWGIQKIKLSKAAPKVVSASEEEEGEDQGGETGSRPKVGDTVKIVSAPGGSDK